MNKPKIRLLGIAPYEGMKASMLQVAENRDDIEITVFVGDLEKGVQIVKDNNLSDYDAIISRGGTAKAIEAVTDIPVIEINISVYDIIRSIRLADNIIGSYAIVGFPNITNCAHILCDLLQYKVDIFTIQNTDEVEPLMLDLKRKGYQLILCDMISNTMANRIGLSSILITSGNESIEESFSMAVNLCKNHVRLKSENQLLLEVINKSHSQITIFDSNGTIKHTCFSIQTDPDIIRHLASLVPKCFKSGELFYTANLNNHYYEIHGTTIQIRDEICAVFYLRTIKEPVFRDNVFLCQNLSELDTQAMVSHHGCSAYSAKLQKQILQYSEFAFPILILGEFGTKKSEIAKSLYTNSNAVDFPFVTIDCSRLNTETIQALAADSSSPLFYSGCTIFFKNIHTLSLPGCNMLLETILLSASAYQNHFVFSYSFETEDYENSPVYHELINRIHCITIHTLPLRLRSEDIPYLANLYISRLNLLTAKQLIGIKPDAMKLLQTFQWKYNQGQFYRVLKELALMSSTPFITAEDTAMVLAQETCYTEASPYVKIDFTKSLSDINQEIIRMVLKEENGNQSQTAKRLGISRSTLWRMLN